MVNVVITGGSSGLGYSLAKQFSKKNDKVVICSRNKHNLKSALENLNGNVYGFQCDVSNSENIESFVSFSKTKVGKIDYWINNAGVNSGRKSLQDTDYGEIQAVLDTNLRGTIYSCKAARKIMKKEGHIFNVDGCGSRGEIIDGYFPYSVSKYCIPYVTRYLSKELDIGVHTISPGMIRTDLSLKDYEDDMDVFDILGEETDVVAEYLYSEILKTKGTNTYVSYLTLSRLLPRLIKYFKKKITI